ncbi:glycosyltransferase family 4 protein [Dactylosporangium sp. CA-139066]|uniref:glycosyltransferase family 4 protein n=1 Tax=Dactylosporangium sp. CA-139066 TaxID=3239930 RepID=UPI003D905737
MVATKVGFACIWDEPDPVKTWSYTPWSLREALRAQADVVDVGVRIPPLARKALKAMHARRRDGRWVSTWELSPITDAYIHRAIAGRASAENCDAVLQIADLAIIDRPYFLYQDLSFDLLLRLAEDEAVAYGSLNRDEMLRCRDRQQKLYEKASGVLAMSGWLARSLVEDTGLPPEKVHIVHPGRSSVVSGGELPVRSGPRRRLLIVGTDFIRKGGELVVAALARLRKEVDPEITLTVVGPRSWPLPGDVPDGVDFVGPKPREEVGALFDSHDLFVMPSRKEAFGIVFAEAIARGLPCIGRNAFAMPEIIEPGLTGALVDGDDPDALAATIAATLADDALYAKCRDRAEWVGSHFSWQQSAADALAAIHSVVPAA